MPKAPLFHSRKKKPVLGKNGRVLTVKHLAEKDYQTIHQLPHGFRQKVLKALLACATQRSKRYGPGWHLKLLSQKTI